MTKKKINKKQEKQKLNYLALGLVFVVSFGALVGLTVFDNVAIGIGIGIGFGLALGLSLGVAFDNSTDENKH